MLAPLLLTGALAPARGLAQEVPRGEYLRFVPLSQPKLTEQTDARRHLDFYGD